MFHNLKTEDDFGFAHKELGSHHSLTTSAKWNRINNSSWIHKREDTGQTAAPQIVETDRRTQEALAKLTRAEIREQKLLQEPVPREENLKYDDTNQCGHF